MLLAEVTGLVRHVTQVFGHDLRILVLSLHGSGALLGFYFVPPL